MHLKYCNLACIYQSYCSLCVRLTHIPYVLFFTQGLQSHLQQAKLKRQVYASQLVTDQQSHAVLTRADVHRKYHT
ncbi:hypothetical protein EON63_12595 [archaeon]|nr:MAG: hypothetical protein EON63_12595 [archaeon]